MILLVYDGSFEGFLSAVFDIYEYRFSEVRFAVEGIYQQNIFARTHAVITTDEKAARVRAGLLKRISRESIQQLYNTFLSEIDAIENTLLSYIRYAFSGQTDIARDFSHPAVLRVQQTARMVHREKHRMEAFIRFQLTSDDLFFAIIEPDFNVLPLIKKHFADRYADQCWMIYDARRKYGLYYDKKEVSSVTISFGTETSSGKDIKNLYSSGETLYQKLWQQYFSSVNIEARKNMKLHIQHMPRRYWKYLTEKS